MHESVWFYRAWVRREGRRRCPERDTSKEAALAQLGASTWDQQCVHGERQGVSMGEVHDGAGDDGAAMIVRQERRGGEACQGESTINPSSQTVQLGKPYA